MFSLHLAYTIRSRPGAKDINARVKENAILVACCGSGTEVVSIVLLFISVYVITDLILEQVVAARMDGPPI
jgi:hypothetical protein